MICFWLPNNITQTQAYFSSKFFWTTIIKAFVFSIKKAVLGFGVNIFLTVIYSFLPKSRLLLQNYRNFQLNTCSCNERPHFTASTIARYGIWLSYGQWELSIRALQTSRSFCSKEGVPSLFPSFLFLADWDVSETEPIDGNCVLKLAQQQKKEVWFSDICEAIISAQTCTGVKNKFLSCLGRWGGVS